MQLDLRRWIFYSLVLCISTRFVAQERPVDSLQMGNLEEVVITATRTPRQLSSLPLPVTLVSRSQIKKTGTIRVSEILAEQTGLILIPDESGFEGLQIQGIDNDYVMIMIDGVPLVGRNAGNFNLNRLSVGNIKQIEVVKGPSSALYGSEALGGVVNIITETPKIDKLKGNTSFRAGSFTTLDASVNLRQKFEKFGYAFSANRFSSEGYDLVPDDAGQTVSPFENYTLSARLFYDFSEDLKLFSSTRFYNQNQENNTESNGDFFQGNIEENEWNTHLRLNHKWNSSLRLEYEFYYTNYRANEFSQSPLTSDVLFQSDFNQQLFRPEIRGIYSFEKAGTLTSGIGYQYDELDRTFFDSRVNFQSQYVYSQWDVEPLKKLNIIVGARFDNHSEYSNQLSPKLAIRYEINENFALKSSLGYGFKAPDFRQLYFDFSNAAVGYTVLGFNVAEGKLQELVDAGQILEVIAPTEQFENPLKAESSIGFNLGGTLKIRKWTSEFNFFRNDIKNLIDTQIIARKFNGQNVFSYRNFDEVFTTGLEVDMTYNWSKNFTIQGGYQLLYAYDKTQLESIENGEVFTTENGRTVPLERSDYFGLINRSRHTANLKFFYNVPFLKSNANLRLIYRSKYGLFDTNGNAILDTNDSSFVDGFVTANVTTNTKLGTNFELQVGINNLFDYTDLNIPNINGIQFFTTLNYNF